MGVHVSVCVTPEREPEPAQEPKEQGREWPRGHSPL